MAYISDQQKNTGLFVPETNVWDASRIRELNTNSQEFKDLIVRLYQNINNIAVALNQKDSALYIEEEFITGQQYFISGSTTSLNTLPNQLELRPVYRKVIDFGVLPNNTSKSVAHGITMQDSFTFTRIYGTATKPTTSGVGRRYIPIPYVSQTAGSSIELYVDSTNVTIITAANYSAFTRCVVVLEWVTY